MFFSQNKEVITFDNFMQVQNTVSCNLQFYSYFLQDYISNKCTVCSETYSPQIVWGFWHKERWCDWFRGVCLCHSVVSTRHYRWQNKMYVMHLLVIFYFVQFMVRSVLYFMYDGSKYGGNLVKWVCCIQLLMLFFNWRNTEKTSSSFW
jgi:hypothetical protein